ncbi:GGDEF domain-containing protein [Vibrio sp. 404]|uniref:diguanylate cyclase n=1 Tax=Vibrio marinisediminis TaxID=2758441 RepID=A0A7W2IS03_9VIBR|nr:GGDEF domain-containing protein [Vibrio marinisediminis]MBA5760810.1 GGDEF domain-containing protein [Vibrio marinisediminis]
MEDVGFKDVFERCPSGIVITDYRLKIIDANEAAHRVLSMDSLLGRSLAEIFDEVSKVHMMTFSQYLSSGRKLCLDCRFSTSEMDGWCELSATKVKGNNTEEDVIIWSLADISIHKRRESELENLAYYDGLTGVYTRYYFLHLANLHMDKFGIEKQPFCVLVLDLDKFKQINDRYGHSKGDEILQNFASITKDKLRKSDLFGRIGGEEFAILLPNTTERVSLAIANRICHEVERFFVQMKITVSIGIASIFDRQDSIKNALERADVALYDVKRNGRNHALLSSTKVRTTNEFNNRRER